MKIVATWNDWRLVKLPATEYEWQRMDSPDGSQTIDRYGDYKDIDAAIEDFPPMLHHRGIKFEGQIKMAEIKKEELPPIEKNYLVIIQYSVQVGAKSEEEARQKGIDSFEMGLCEVTAELDEE